MHEIKVAWLMFEAHLLASGFGDEYIIGEYLLMLRERPGGGYYDC